MDIFKIKPEIISIHVPKTAGSTFRSILEKNYRFGFRYIYEHKDLHIWNNGFEYRSKNPFVKVVHGHIEAHPNWKKQFPFAKLVAWIRDPVDRTISAYYHWKKDKDHGDDRHAKFMEIQPDLVEFASMDDFAPTVNALQTYMGSLSPSDYFFIGRTEYFDKDLQILGAKLNWKHLKYEKRNVNVEKPGVSSTVREQLRQVLKSEYELYNEFLKSK